MKRRLNEQVLQRGDIILTTTNEFPSKAIRKATKSDISHAMVYVQHCSVIHAVTEGVRSENTQRIFFDENLAVHVMRLPGGLPSNNADRICNFVRSVVGRQYAYMEAVRAWKNRWRRFSPKQFCSRLAAQAYADSGYKIVFDPNFCTPEQLAASTMLIEVPNATVEVSDEEVAFWKDHTSATDLMHEISYKVLNGVRKIDRKVQDFNDVAQFVIDNQEHDIAVSAVYVGSGYLTFWQYDRSVNPWHYDIDLMEEIALYDAVRAYCLSTVNDEPRNNNRFTQTLAVLTLAHSVSPRNTLSMLISLYGNLVSTHKIRHDVATEWLNRHGR